jgi:hypothetical protein
MAQNEHRLRAVNYYNSLEDEEPHRWALEELIGDEWCEIEVEHRIEKTDQESNMTPNEEAIWRMKVTQPDVTVDDISDKLGIDPMEVHAVLAKSGDAEPERIRLLKRGIELTGGDRNKTYGPPYDNLTACADVWKAYLCAKFRGAVVDELSFQITAEDVAHMMQLVKMTRTFHGPYHADNYLDNAVYGAIAGECRMIEESL